MTQPSPTPSSGTFGGITLTVPSTSSSSGGDKYDLGVWGDQQINPGDLPILGQIIGSGSKTTGDDLVKAFASASPVVLAEIQRTLYLGGFYGQHSTYNPTYGVISSEDISAFAHAVTLAGQSGQALSDLLLNQAKVGTAAGIAGAQAQLSKAQTKLNKPLVVKQPYSTADLEAAASQAFEKVLGRKANPHEAAAFAAAYQATVVGLDRSAHAQAVSDASQTVAGLSPDQATGFDQQLAQIGQTPEGHAPTPFRDDALRGSDIPFQPPPSGFGEQLQQLQSLGTAVTKASAAKTPTIAAPSEIDVQPPPTADVAAENFARSRHPKQAAGTDLANAFDMFMGIIGSKFGG